MRYERFIMDQDEDTLPGVPMTFVRCESQRNVRVFIPEAFDINLVTTVAENFRYEFRITVIIMLMLLPLIAAKFNSPSESSMMKYCKSSGSAQSRKDPPWTHPATAYSISSAINDDVYGILLGLFGNGLLDVTMPSRRLILGPYLH